MFFAILTSLRDAQVPVTCANTDAEEALDADLAEQTWRISTICPAPRGEGRAQSRQVRSRVRTVFKGLEAC